MAGSSDSFAVFVHSMLGPGVSLMVSSHDTILSLRKKLDEEHIGEITVNAIMAERDGILYKLQDCLPLDALFDREQRLKGCFLLMEATNRVIKPHDQSETDPEKANHGVKKKVITTKISNQKGQSSGAGKPVKDKNGELGAKKNLTLRESDQPALVSSGGRKRKQQNEGPSSNMVSEDFHKGPVLDGVTREKKKHRKRKVFSSLEVPPIKENEPQPQLADSIQVSEKNKDFNLPEKPVSPTKSEIRSEHLHHQSGPSLSTRRRKKTRSSKDRKLLTLKLNTRMFEDLMENIWEKVSEEKKRHCIYFDSLWFFSYRDELKSKDETTKKKILKWIKNKKVLSKKYVFVPIVCWGHWSLLILCHFGDANRSPCMLLLDSLLDTDPKRLENDIRRFVYDIYKISGRKESESFVSDIPFLIPKVPQQINGDECGTCVLYFMFRFIGSAPDTLSLDKYPYFLTEKWFTRKEFEKFARKVGSSSKEKIEEGKEQQQLSDIVKPYFTRARAKMSGFARPRARERQHGGQDQEIIL